MSRAPLCPAATCPRPRAGRAGSSRSLCIPRDTRRSNPQCRHRHRCSRWGIPRLQSHNNTKESAQKKRSDNDAPGVGAQSEPQAPPHDALKAPRTTSENGCGPTGTLAPMTLMVTTELLSEPRGSSTCSTLLSVSYICDCSSHTLSARRDSPPQQRNSNHR